MARNNPCSMESLSRLFIFSMHTVMLWFCGQFKTNGCRNKSSFQAIIKFRSILIRVNHLSIHFNYFFFFGRFKEFVSSVLIFDSFFFFLYVLAVFTVSETYRSQK